MLELDQYQRLGQVLAMRGLSNVVSCRRHQKSKRIKQTESRKSSVMHLAPKTFCPAGIISIKAQSETRERTTMKVFIGADHRGFQLKGEILELRIPELNLNEIVSKEVFLMPIGFDRYKVGATYRWDELNMEITGSAREELISKLKNILPELTEIINQKAGIRPTMHDRKPVIGFLEEMPQIGIFNGLGAKGVLIGPYLAIQFAEYLLGNSTQIPHEINIDRYFMMS